MNLKKCYINVGKNCFKAVDTSLNIFEGFLIYEINARLSKKIYVYFFHVNAIRSAVRSLKNDSVHICKKVLNFKANVKFRNTKKCEILANEIESEILRDRKRDIAR